MSIQKTFREYSNIVPIGTIPMGEQYPIRLQSMTTTNTLDIEATVAQCIEIADAGADFVRITAQGIAQAEALQKIKQSLQQKNYNIPIIADIHFQPAAAMIAAKYVEKVRINPGNFAEANTHEENIDQQRIQKFQQLLNICKQYNTALRIGVNHGSLSARMLSKYGDTPEGMMESAMEYLRICQQENFAKVVVSMKSSNTRIMVYASRLLAQAMQREAMNFPLHLGVTEAGAGEDGRIKSAVGIGTLLADGLGNTFRVSLTETPKNEIPVAQKLLDHFIHTEYQRPAQDLLSCPTIYQRRKTHAHTKLKIGGENRVGVIINLSQQPRIHAKDIEALGFVQNDHYWQPTDNAPDAIYIGNAELDSFPQDGLTLYTQKDENILHCTTQSLTPKNLQFLKNNPQQLLILEQKEDIKAYSIRQFIERLQSVKLHNPVLLHLIYKTPHCETLQLFAAADFGALLIDGLVDGIMLSNEYNDEPQFQTASSLGPPNYPMRPIDIHHTCLAILQATRTRFSKTEYIACPGCGRTLFDLQKTLQDIKQHTQGLKGLKIAVMGCIVNGVGEMADADYGYVGAAAGKISLYKGKICVQKNIEQSKAVQALLQLIHSS
ncbi:MAG: (E)-4-hydroxy-3-methylbut-2-enyl-diphosphate synthase [Bacteroidales bacterium]